MYHTKFSRILREPLVCAVLHYLVNQALIPRGALELYLHILNLAY
jgi:hypothetical protein